jgi:FixJ family two-component response regulator
MDLPTWPATRNGTVARDSLRAHIHLVDDDEFVRTALLRLLTAEGLVATAHACAESFLARYDPREHGCLLLDVVMPGLDGLALQEAMAQRGSHMPIIFFTGRADVPMCAHAMKRGACDFLIKPVDDEVLLAAIERALVKDVQLKRACEQRSATEALFGTLTPREREVIGHVIAGRLNKQIAADLGASEKTIKVHRARGLEKLRVRSVADLVRLVERSRSGSDIELMP